ncbi:hypothetical protein DEA8626_03556 [Defluviimonas aquaemixtae]|uniref:Uncharacterized protein n=1 Tax=Albidovulum aquaemixtae TaxID=1542388 RepID=A0A2R8BME3_9RHOB|nr:DUF6638 family protein [Defluviimonas aquaemixtae]SPH24504.1 hypothetical protein DEA8626_03556 [Defluviimonas aquaemixtae]
MKRLIEKGLMFGNLVHVESPALVERYNRALKALTGKETKLADFHIDVSGYSPEIGDEFSDHLYLNHNGCNRQFILLTTDQKNAPLLNARFSTSRGILTRFIEENEAQLFTLTARDAVAGELENTVYDLESPARLFDIRRITVIADTTGNHVAEGQKLSGLIERFRTEEDGWWDDVLIAEMITLAERTGDVTRNPIELKSTRFDQGNFWTAHFGGIYVFRDVKHPAAISVGQKQALGQLPIKYVFDMDDRNQIAKFLEINDLVEPIVNAPGADAAAILRQKMDFIVVTAAAGLGLEIGHGSRRELRQAAAALGARLPDEFQGLAALLRWVETGADWPRITSSHPSYFYTLRAKPHADRDLVNMLLSELSPLDVRQLFICHKELFYHLYRSWPEPKKAFVADYLEREYQIDKAGARRALFGSEPDMREPGDSRPGWPSGREDDIVDIVGPWGAVRKERR